MFEASEKSFHLKKFPCHYILLNIILLIKKSRVKKKKKFGLYIRKNKDVIRAQRIDECFQNVKDFEKKKVPGFLIPLYVFYRSKFKLTFHWQNGCH